MVVQSFCFSIVLVVLWNSCAFDLMPSWGAMLYLSAGIIEEQVFHRALTKQLGLYQGKTKFSIHAIALPHGEHSCR